MIETVPTTTEEEPRLDGHQLIPTCGQTADAVARSPNAPTGRQIASVNQPEAKVKSGPKLVEPPEVDSAPIVAIWIKASAGQNIPVQFDCLISNRTDQAQSGRRPQFVEDAD